MLCSIFYTESNDGENIFHLLTGEIVWYILVSLNGCRRLYQQGRQLSSVILIYIKLLNIINTHKHKNKENLSIEKSSLLITCNSRSACQGNTDLTKYILT